MKSATATSRRSVLLSTGAFAAAAIGATMFARWARASSIVGKPGTVTIEKFDDAGKSLGAASVAKVVKSDAEWQAQLKNDLVFNVTRQEGTETPFTGPNWDNHSAGLYRCICCDNALYTNDTKFDSGTGWPSFWQPISERNLVHVVAQQGGYKVSCAECDAHLGHVFDDGPKPTGLRYCMDGVAMRFIPRAAA
ncbi:MAG TPA: peptide-methionine (R)-S-oxide reductase MsrB [Bauldia sp.]|jgi:peptide-methionine (R)-S-oxide reductase